MIDSERVEALLLEGLSGSTEVGLKVEGVVNSYMLDPAKLEPHREEIAAMIAQLPTQFFPPEQGGGGGWSFLNLCELADGEQWTGLHLRCEQLYAISAALDLASMLTPRGMWPMLPGGMPYLLFQR